MCQSLSQLFVIVLCALNYSLTDGFECSYVDSCTCDMSDGSGLVNLHSLALEGSSLYDAAFQKTAPDGWTYKYNPCNGFYSYGYSNLAISQSDEFAGYGYDLGVQSSAAFLIAEETGLSIEYKSADGVRLSRVLLICQQAVNVNTFEVVGELVVLEYDFILTSACACPGMCDNDGLLQPLPTISPSPGESPDKSCTFIDYCTCEMTDGSGRVNLHGLALNGLFLSDSYFTVSGGDGWYYKYNPCNGFTAAGFTDLALFQSGDQYGYSGYDLGVQSHSFFNFSDSNGLTIHYNSSEQIRFSRVLLVCSPNTNEHKFEYIGELVILEYDFVLTSPCACPGACNDDGVIGGIPTSSPSSDVTCRFKDTCTCEMSDNSGEVNLHSLGLEGNTLYDAAFSVAGGDDWVYNYNPCNGFSFASYTNLAIGQEHETGGWGYDLGIQSSAFFNMTDTSGLAIHYQSADGMRKSRVLLVCQNEVNENTFEFVGELIILEYEFILQSPCACPGVCDNDGPLIPLPTPTANNGDNEKACKFVDSCSCEMSDGTGNINLHSLIQPSSYDSAFTEFGSDGWYYKYSPCYGFYFNGFYDTAIAQSSDYYGYGYGFELGTQSSAKFIYTESDGTSIKYESTDQLRTSRVLLLCEPGTTSHKFEYIGELTTMEYDFALTSPCACAGGCDDYGVIETPSGTQCEIIDSCTCDMSDGSGRINLRSISKVGDSLTEGALKVDGLDGWLYEYNPCEGFSVLGYSDLALAQVNVHRTAANDLGVQSNARFQYSADKDLSIHYDSADRVRKSKVLLVCDPFTKDPIFEFVGELTILEYDFILTTACACPGECDDYGPTNPRNTQSPNDGNGGDSIDNINVNVQQESEDNFEGDVWLYVGATTIALIFHDLFLILVIVFVIILVKQTRWCVNDEGSRQMLYGRFMNNMGRQNNV